MTLRILSGLREVASDYDGFILDLWGVLHDGSKPFPGVLDALQRLIDTDKRLVVLSNAPRRAEQVIERMGEIGIPPGLYHHVHSSGEEAWQHLSRRDDAFYVALGSRCFYIGPPRDEAILAGLALSRVDTIDEADFVLNIGPWGSEATVESFLPLLIAAAARDLPMVCANADLVVMHQGHRMICAGALAERYEQLGGRVRWHGKPFPSVYETCFTLLEVADRRRILAVGDGLRTDIAGANGVGIDSLLVASGIHAEELGWAPETAPDHARIASVITDARPTALMAHFCW